MHSRAPGRLQDAWDTRPVRPRENRMVAGVAAGIGRRYAVDPVLIRIAFVVAGIYGAGVPLYLLACVLLPDGGRAGRGRAGTVVTVVLVVAAVISAVVLLSVGRGGWIVSVLLSLGLLAALHRTRRHLGAAPDGTGPPTGVEVPVTAPGAPATATEPVAPAPTAPVSTAPVLAAPVPAAGSGPVVDGARPHDPPYPPDVPAAPVPGPPPPHAEVPAGPGPRRRSRITPVTLALAVVAGAAVGVLGLTVPGAVGAAVVPATALAVVGAGLVVGAFRHAGRWLVPFAALLAVATWLTGAVPWTDLRGGVGTVAETPSSVAAVAPEYRRGIGDVALDLNRLDLRAAPPVRTSARVGIGSVAVIVPPGADLVVRGDAGLGDVSVPGQTRTGSGAALIVSDDGPDGPGGGRIELDLHATVGSVAVSRG